MKKYLLLILAGFLVCGCMASFPKKYDPTFAMNPLLGKDQRISATAKFENAFGKEMREESLKLQILLDRKIENWGFSKDKTGKHLDVTVKNVIAAGDLAGGIITGIICGLTLYVIPSIAVDNYRMTVVITQEEKEPITRVYNSSITTYQQIFLV
jgi:hypothetical protein